MATKKQKVIKTEWERKRQEAEEEAISEGSFHNKREVAELRKQPGNSAAIRDALHKIHDAVNSLDENCAVDPVEIRDIAKKAIKKPPRNCDAYDSADDMMEEYADNSFLSEWKEWRETGKCHPLMLDAFLCINWLFLTRKKGETDGSK